MKKTLIALTVAALPMAAAQADSSNVTVYGQMNASMDFVNTNASGQDRLNRVSSNSSRIGFKGTEDLGNGMAANFQIEEQVGIDAAGTATANNFTSRNTYVGLSGKSWGEIRVGIHDTPYKLATSSLDVFSDTGADYNSIIGNVNGTNIYDNRASNVLAYISPNMSGFQVIAAWVAANEAGNTSGKNPEAISLAGIYANGPIFASLGYEKHDGSGLGGTTAHTAATTFNKTTGTKLGFGYNFGDAKVGFVWENLNDDAASSANDRTAYGVNVAYTMGANVLKAAYMAAKDGNSATDTGARNLAIGVDHNMSKRTAVYALYAKTTNASGATFGVGGGQGGNYLAATAGEDPSMLSLGIKHSF